MTGDLKYAFRMLLKSPAFSGVVIVTLALGIGANTAIFSVVEGTLLRALPFPHADRLVRLYEASDDSGARGSTLNLSEQTFRQWGEYGSDIFEGIAAATGTNVTVGAGTDNTARNVTAARVSANFFSVLGLPPALGRTFTADEDREGGPAVVIISDDFWRQNLVGAALCALLIAAANFAGLLLARVVDREAEFALRAALGASWRTLVRQQLVQALVLSSLGAVCGLLLAWWTTPVLVAMSPEGTDITGS